MGTVAGWFWTAKGTQNVMQARAGHLWHKWWDGKQWHNEDVGIPEPLDPNSSVYVFQTPGQYHCVAVGQDGDVVHVWQDDNGATWGAQKLP